MARMTPPTPKRRGAKRIIPANEIYGTKPRSRVGGRMHLHVPWNKDILYNTIYSTDSPGPAAYHVESIHIGPSASFSGGRPRSPRRACRC